MTSKERIDILLTKLIGHKVTVTFVQLHGETIREASGILKNSTKGIITLEIYDNFGGKSYYFLNRYNCLLHSVIDEGKP